MNQKQLDLFSRVVEVATRAHESQKRKGNGLPYITHPFTVAILLLKADCEDEVVMAGLLHDTIEDTDLTYEELQAQFGVRVASIVKECSEQDKSKSWEERKQSTLRNLETISIEACMVVCADKLHNIRSTAQEFAQKGDAIWDVFNRGKDKQEWYYRGIIQALEKRLPEFPLYQLLQHEVESLFKKMI
ncbi:HD domain-containing protein [Microbacteriaceae bacterium 4G12]